MDLKNRVVSTTAMSNRSNRAKPDTASTFIGYGEFPSFHCLLAALIPQVYAEDSLANSDLRGAIDFG